MEYEGKFITLLPLMIQDRINLAYVRIVSCFEQIDFDRYILQEHPQSVHQYNLKKPHQL